MNLPAGRSPDHVSADGGTAQAAGSPDPERRRRLDEIFGDVLPDVTGDEKRSGRSGDDSWYLENRPPHHG